jgi:hypothetical protein
MATAVQEPGIVRIFFDLRQSTPGWQDERLIVRTFEQAMDHDTGEADGLTQPVLHATDAARWQSMHQQSSIP